MCSASAISAAARSRSSPSTHCSSSLRELTPSSTPSLRDALDDGSVDWGQFDNDGPDGIPNSGDDDGFVVTTAAFDAFLDADDRGMYRLDVGY